MKHHPDKRKAQGEDVHQDDDDYFSCITKAYETLGNTLKRRSYDSVDPEFDDTLPTDSETEKDFYGVLGNQFKINARWSEKKKVPLLGDENSDRAHVEKFYDFWYDFQSWREYSYLDEEEKEKGQHREERRWIDKQNKVIRAKRKKEEMSRIRSLVDLAYNNDPRIVKFKREDKEKKLAVKRAKQDAAQAAKAEEERLLKEAQIAKQKADQAEQKRIEAIQKEKEAQKRLMKKERKTFRDTAKSNDYYTTEDNMRLRHIEGVEKICEMFKYLELQELNSQLKTGGKDLFLKALDDTEKRLEEERRLQAGPKNNISNNSGLKVVNKKAMWNTENVQLLIKAVNLFPAGTLQRWEVISNFINQHGTDLVENKFNAKDVLNKAKELQSGDFSKSELKTQVNQQAFESFEKNRKDLKVVDKSDISVKDTVVTPAAPAVENKTNKRNSKNVKQNGISVDNKESATKLMNGHTTNTPSENHTTNKNERLNNHNNNLKTEEKIRTEKSTEKIIETIKEKTPPVKENTPPVKEKTPPVKEKTPPIKEEAKPWAKDEQELLEQAIKTYPITTPDRWDRIAECIPNRSKKDCLRRVKELVDRVNAKREAQQIIK